MSHHGQASEARRLTDALRSSSERSKAFASRSTLEEREHTLQMVLEGGVLRQRSLADGRKHTIAVYYRDDVINLMNYGGSRQPRTRDSLLALKGTVIGYVADEDVARIRAEAGPTDSGMASLICRELAIAQEGMLSLGQRTASEGMAHFFCETLIRCAPPDANHKIDRCALHITQDLLSSILGISTVHVNRTLQQLRHQGLADIVAHELVVSNYDGLRDLGEFDDAYLAPI